MSSLVRAYAYRPQKSFFHSLGPMVKFIWVLSIGTLASVLNSAIPTIIILVVLFSIVGLAKTPRGNLKVGLLFFGLISIAQFNTLLWLSWRGSPMIWGYGPFIITLNSLEYAVAVGFRLLILGFSAMVFVNTTNSRDMALSLIQNFRLPYRIGYMLFLVMRYIPLFEIDLRTIQDAHRVRGIGEKTGLIGRFRDFRRYTIPLLVMELTRARVTATAMETRAFGAYPTRTYVTELRTSRRDKIFVAVWLLFCAVLLVLGFTYFTVFQIGKYY